MKLSASVLVVLAATTLGSIGVSAVSVLAPSPATGAEDANTTEAPKLELSDAHATNESAAGATEILEEDVFMPACIAHVTTLVERLHASYTYTQIPTVLEHWCMEENYTHRFDNDTICTMYSKLLVDAHASNSSAVGYSDICKQYYHEEIVAGAADGTWLWAKGDETLPKFEVAGKDVNETAESALDACGAKMKKIMVRLQGVYTYEQLPMMLRNFCQGAKRFRNKAHKKHCNSVVNSLTHANELDVQGNVTEEKERFAAFCKKFDVQDIYPIEFIALESSVSLKNATVHSAVPVAAPITATSVTNDTMVNATVANEELPPFDSFLPACLAHTTDLMKELPEAYTVQQLSTVLQHSCEMDPHVHNFNSQEACEEFAQQLATAQSAKDPEHKYTAFCRDYYVHKGGVIGESEVEEPKADSEAAKKKAGNANMQVAIGLGVVLILVVLGCFFARKKK